MAQPWARLATLLGRVHGQPCQGGSLPWRNIDFFCRWSQGLGVWSEARGLRRAKNSETAHWWGMCWDARAQRRNRSASPLRDAAASWSLREIFFKWVPHRGKQSQGCSVFTSGVPNMSGTRLTWKKFDWSQCVFQLGPPSLLLGLMAQASLEEFQLSTPSLHDIVDVCRLHSWGPWGGSHQVQLKSGWAVMQSFSPFRALPLHQPVVWPGTSRYTCSTCLEHYKFFLARVFPGGRASGSVWLADWPIS